ncbi:MAG: DUF3316 domain-containing protein [Paludibacteraceae bacterium]|nr:DUF3316 domain-containing protein [Paludibacteraceae bacterium]
MRNTVLYIFSLLLLLATANAKAGVRSVSDVDDTVSVSSPTYNYSLTNRAVTLSLGAWRSYDSYLSPLLYKGAGFKLMDERLKMMTKNFDKVSRYSETNLSIASLLNPAETSNMMYFDFQGVTGAHYHLRPVKNMNLLLGSLLDVELGARYNTVNQNNPVSMIFDANLWVSAMCYYHIRLKSRTFTLRDHFSMPFVGVMFSPNYMQTYYEIFSLGNYDGVFPVTSFGSRWQWRNKLSIDMPIKPCTFRVGLLAERSVTEVNKLETRTMNVSAMFGLVYNFNTFKGTQKIPADYRNPVE